MAGLQGSELPSRESAVSRTGLAPQNKLKRHISATLFKTFLNMPGASSEISVSVGVNYTKVVNNMPN